jgi:hypothetical protein
MVRRDLIKFIGDSNIGICAFIMIWKAFGLFPITNDPDLFRRLLYGGIQDLGEPAVTELLLDWLGAFITETERDRIVAWHLGALGRHPWKHTLCLGAR